MHEAENDFNKAQTDESVFTKAESDLKSPIKSDGAVAAPTPAVLPRRPPSKSRLQSHGCPSTGPCFINEDYSANPKKASAVADANKSLKTGNRQAAIEKLKLAEVDIETTLAVVPLKQTMTDVHQAAELIDNGKYYEASQMLPPCAEWRGVSTWLLHLVRRMKVLESVSIIISPLRASG